MRHVSHDLRRVALGAVMACGLIAGAAITPSQAQGFIAPTDPAVARLLGLNTGGTFVLTGADTTKLAVLSSAKHFRICVLAAGAGGGGTEDVGVKATSEVGEIDIRPGHCGDLDGAVVEVTPLRELGGDRRIHGMYKLAD